MSVQYQIIIVDLVAAQTDVEFDMPGNGVCSIGVLRVQPTGNGAITVKLDTRDAAPIPIRQAIKILSQVGKFVKKIYVSNPALSGGTLDLIVSPEVELDFFSDPFAFTGGLDPILASARRSAPGYFWFMESVLWDLQTSGAFFHREESLGAWTQANVSDQKGFFTAGAADDFTHTQLLTPSLGVISVASAFWSEFIPFQNRLAGHFAGWYYGLVAKMSDFNPSSLRVFHMGVANNLGALDFLTNANQMHVAFRINPIGGPDFSNILTSVNDGATVGAQIDLFDTGLSMTEIVRVLEWVVIPGSVRFYIDSNLVHISTITFPPDSTAGLVAPNVRVGLHLEGDGVLGTTIDHSYLRFHGFPIEILP